MLGPTPAVAILDDFVCAGPGIDSHIECFDLGGGASIAFDLDRAPEPVTPELEREFLDAMRLMISRESWPSWVASVSISDELPPFGRLIAGAQNELWVGPLDPIFAARGVTSVPERAVLWRVFRGGTLLGCIETPRRFRAMSAGRDWIAGVLADDLDVESAVLFRFDRTATPDGGSPVDPRCR
jgi:hypothetical protein